MKGVRKETNAEIHGPVAAARHQPDIGDVTEHGAIAAECVPVFERTDTTGHIEGLEPDHCQPRGCRPSERLTVSYTDGSEEVGERGDVYCWPPGETPRADTSGV